MFLHCCCYRWLTTKFSLYRPVLSDIRLWHLHKKCLFSFWTEYFLVGSEYLGVYRSCMSSYLCSNVRIIENRGVIHHKNVMSENKRLKCPFMIPLQFVFAQKPRQRNKTFFKLCHFYCLSICLIFTVFRFVGAKLHFRFHKFSAFWHALFFIKSCQIIERY